MNKEDFFIKIVGLLIERNKQYAIGCILSLFESGRIGIGFDLDGKSPETACNIALVVLDSGSKFSSALRIWRTEESDGLIIRLSCPDLDMISFVEKNMGTHFSRSDIMHILNDVSSMYNV